MLQRQDGPPDCPLASGQRRGVRGQINALHPMLGQNVRQTFRRAFGPAGDHDAPAGFLQPVYMFAHGVEHVHAVLGALGREGPPLFPAGADRACLVRICKG